MIISNQYTVKQVLEILPNHISQAIEELGYDSDILGAKELDTPGDLQDLLRMYIHDIQDQGRRLNDFIVWKDLIMSICSDYGFQQIEDFGPFKDFKEKYPNMAQTMLVWGWS